MPLTHLLEPMFFEEHPQQHEPVERVVQTSPFRFTREDIVRRLDTARADNEGFHGPRVTLEAPTMPPMALTVERLASGQKTRRYRTTANTIFHVTDGAGETTQLARNILSGSAATPSLRGWRPHEDTAVLESVIPTCSHTAGRLLDCERTFSA